MKILLVDDDSTIRMLTTKILSPLGCDIIQAKDGCSGWECINEYSPDIAIIDCNMAQMCGLELCRKIRNEYTKKYTYLIMLTANDTMVNMQNAFKAGVDDFITKPIDKNILTFRVAVGKRVITYHQELTKQKEQLMAYNSQMEELANQRAKQLIHTERMASVGLLSAGIAHEINNPTAFISGNIQTIDRFWNDLSPNINADNFSTDKLDFILEEMPKTIEGIKNGVSRISKIVNGLRTFCRKDNGTQGLFQIKECIEQALELCRNRLKYNITVEKDLSENLPCATGDSQQIEQVIVNLLTNAADAIGEKKGTIKIQAVSDNNFLLISVSDSGTGIPQNKINDIWQPFYTTKPVGKGTGLGLSTVLGIIQSHNGTITVENQSKGGAIFKIKLPVGDNGEKNEN